MVRNDMLPASRGVIGAVLLACLGAPAVAHDEQLGQAIAENDRDLFYHIPKGGIPGDIFSDQIHSGPFEQAVGLAFDPLGKLFVVEKQGKVFFARPDGVVAQNPMIDISEEVGNWGAHGLLGMAFDPDYLSNRYVYFFYVVDHHYLVHFGQPTYDPDADDYFVDTMARITRYEVTNPLLPGGQVQVDPGTRTILVGEDAQSGFPVCATTHGVGTLAFGEDGSLLASFGDGYLENTGSGTCFSEGLVTPAEDVDAFRAQLVESLAGKLIRIDSATGDGLPDNPFYNAGDPRAPESRVWALGLRQPYRMTVRPGSGAVGGPGSIYLGDVGAQTWEELNLITQPGLNFGWPVFSGMEVNDFYFQLKTENLNASNPLFGQTIPGVGLCTSEFFDFQDLIHQEAIGPLDLPNPCDPLQQVPAQLQFEHQRPILAWKHDEPIALTKSFTGGLPTSQQLGEVGTVVIGDSFPGNAAIGGVWYQGTDFPEQFQNAYFIGDYGEGWIKCMTFDFQDRLVEVIPFTENAGGPVAFATNPLSGGLFYIDYNNVEGSVVRKITFVGDLPPVAVANASKTFGPSPLAVVFDGGDSSDPEGTNLTYEWDFGDGTPLSNLSNPLHVFSVVGPDPAVFDVTLKVTDGIGLEDTASLLISLNNTHPTATILSPANGSGYLSTGPQLLTLTSSTSDAEYDPSELECSWDVILYHDNHTHPEPSSDACQAISFAAPHTTDGDVEFYEVRLTVTDPGGLSATTSHWLPRDDDCNLNGFPDADDIAMGLSFDIDFNGTPDECEVDCDADGLQDYFATGAGAVADCNGNRVPDSCDIAIGSSLDLDGDGLPDECQQLQADVSGLSVSAGGIQTMALDAGAVHGGDLFWVLGSVTGTSPTPFGAVFLPLTTPDLYFDWTLLNPFGGPLANSVGFLDAAGTAAPQVILPGGHPATWVGLTLYHAAIIVDVNMLGFEGIELATNPVKLDFLP